MAGKAGTCRYLALTIFVLSFFAALLFPGAAGIGIYAAARDCDRNTDTGPAVAICPSPAADLSGREKKTMPTMAKNAAIPAIDRTVPEKTEIATFALG
jgi:hypothetical protein